MTRFRVKVDVDLYRPVMNAYLAERSDLSARSAAEAVRDRARDLAPKETGRGARSIVYRKDRSSGEGTRYTVGSPLDYMAYQERGTGPILARPGSVLVFKPKGSSVFIFRPRTRGVPAQHFMQKALNSLTIADFKP